MLGERLHFFLHHSVPSGALPIPFRALTDPVCPPQSPPRPCPLPSALTRALRSLSSLGPARSISPHVAMKQHRHPPTTQAVPSPLAPPLYGTGTRTGSEAAPVCQRLSMVRSVLAVVSSAWPWPTWFRRCPTRCGCSCGSTRCSASRSRARHQLFCKLTLRHINKLPEHVLRHVQGKRYQKALKAYEKCQKEGVKYVPACLRQKQQRRQHDEDQVNGSRQPHRTEEFWEPDSPRTDEDEDGEETDDSMSDLYPPGLFPEKSPAAPQNTEANDGFATDSEDDGAELSRENGDLNGDGGRMDVSKAAGKRGKKQSGPSKKKFKSCHQKPKKFKKTTNGK
uniref:Surfeit 2 n=1 Tax=Coturnix japonica TaxID=93934 RepID=A0A8C2T503_COTJA